MFAQEIVALERIAPVLSDLGLEIEPFGGRSFVVRALPQPMQGQDPTEIVVTLLQETTRMRGSDQALRERLAMRIACLGAIKAGDPISLEDAQMLLDDLAQAWSPATCPHGRPALIGISMEELARRFGR